MSSELEGLYAEFDGLFDHSGLAFPQDLGRVDAAALKSLLTAAVARARKVQAFIAANRGATATMLAAALVSPYNEFFADFVQALAFSDNFRFGINSARQHGIFPNGGYGLSRFVTEDASWFRNFNRENTAKASTWDATEDHFVFAPTAAFLGKTLDGMTLSRSQKRAAIKAMYQIITEALADQLAHENEASALTAGESGQLVLKVEKVRSYNEKLIRQVRERILPIFVNP